jgi:HSP20 family protein
MYNLVRPRPVGLRLRPFDRTFDRSLDDLFDSLFAPRRPNPAAPAVASTWRDGVLELTVDLPGVPQDAVDVSVAGRALTISVKTDTSNWQRTLTLGAGLDPEQVSAHYADGRLTVAARPVAEAQPRRIEITAGTPAIESAESDDSGQPEVGDQETSTTA